LGVCVGMQILAHGSEEGERAGLGYVDGQVRLFDADAPTGPLQGPLQLPHMGWNDVAPAPGNRLFAGLDDDARFYFLHSYYFECGRQDDVAAVSTYGREFSCAVTAGNIHGVQFHPEKSHHFGTRLLQNFAEL
jgi:glutamine amidotransferase